jgi:hypothetical protein
MWAEALLFAGDEGAARDKAERALDLARQVGERGEEAYALLVLADLAVRKGEASHAVARYAETGSLAQELGMRPLIARCQLGTGQLLRTTGRHSEARERLAGAVAMLSEMGMTYWLAKATAAMRELPWR